MNRFVIRTTATVAVLVLVLLPSRLLMAQPCDIPFHRIIEDSSALGGESIPSELVNTDRVPLPSLGFEACLVSLSVQIPQVPVVFLQIDGGWHVVIESKELVDDWESVVVAALEKSSFESPLNSADLSRDLCRLLVDPDPRYGMVIDSAESIPTDYDGSDLFRDLTAEGLSPSEIRQRLLSNAPEGIEPPTLTQSCDGTALRFFSWGYFGGEVAEWTVFFGPQNSISKRTLAGSIGSYDLFH